ncbi:CPBP family intramembrane metalloprotease [Clostridium sp. 'deep sea']|uniref:CPBP family intramembrane glutamic endopeptidase n=1 Tax=Clostridium sp. 'deep sea' TaxID=2779445 RepID=UPI00189685C2|nr:CPBP family intramembrane glutamic endopeptidase [Clostridium sp. 'deep sea']QOR36349.1 CPBP family intramembrane metalloprotease [Clostridium sp. 'deep sea']
MNALSKKIHSNLSLLKVLLLVFLPTSILTLLYILAGYLNKTIPSLLMFCILAMCILMPIQLWIILRASKKEYGKYGLKSAFTNHQKLRWWIILLYGSLLFAFAGIMSAIIAPLENTLFSPISSQLTRVIPTYFHWSNIEYLKQYSNSIVLITCIVYFIFNGFIGPVIEEMFFRGYLTSKISRYGKYAPIIITVLFSLYHFWLPFNNIFRIVVFLPAAYLAWKKKNIYISIVFHSLSNIFSVISFIVAVYAA